jgi:hypothetical protein
MLLVQSPDWFRVVFEAMTVIAAAALLVVLVRAGRRYPEIATTSWQWVVVGFIMIVVARLVDLSDELINYRAAYVANVIATFIAEAGMICGLILAAMGFATWFEFMARFFRLRRKE